MSSARDDLPDDVEQLKQLVLASRAEVEHLKLMIAKLRRLQFGRHSEKLDREIEQLELRLEELQVSAVAAAPIRVEQSKAQVPVRRRLPDHLPRTRVEHTPACACPDCGAAMRKIGEDIAESLDYVPARFRVIQHVRPKLACAECERIVQLEAPSRPIERGLAGAGLLAHVLVSKYADHLPLYRQAQIYAREGVELERSTMAEWVAGCFRLVDPLIEALARYVMAAHKLHADDTPVPCSSRGAVARRQAGSGHTCVMTGRPPAKSPRPCCFAIRRTGAASAREATWRHSAAFCKPTPMPALVISTANAFRRRPAGRTHAARSTNFIRQSNLRLPLKRWSALLRSTRSKPRSALARRMSALRFGRRALGRFSSHYANGYA